MRTAVEAFNREDLRALAELCDEDLELVSVLTALEETSYRGKDTWETYFSDMHETWEEWHIEDLRVFDADDDRVAAVFRLVGKGKSSGVPVERTVGLAYRLRQGKLWRLRSYLDPADALVAVGLRAEAGGGRPP